MKKILTICVFILSGCNGIVLNYHPNIENRPIDGSFGNPRFNSKNVRYARGNLEYLTNRTERNNAIYFASVSSYDEIDHCIAKEYIDNYQKFLNVNSEELEEIMRNEHKGANSYEILRKMEEGTLPKYPIGNNVRIMQLLKDKKNKIAFPDYMEYYIDKYSIDENDNKNNELFATIERDENEMIYSETNEINDRDSYVNYYLNTIGKSNDVGNERFSEKLLD